MKVGRMQFISWLIGLASVAVPLKLAVAQPLPSQIVIVPSTMEFRPLPVGQHATQVSLLSNQGKEPIMLAGFVSNAGFTIDNDCSAVLGPRETCSINVRFEATVPGSYHHGVTIIGSDGSKAVLSLFARVTGNADETTADWLSPTWHGSTSSPQASTLAKP